MTNREKHLQKKKEMTMKCYGNFRDNRFWSERAKRFSQAVKSQYFAQEMDVVGAYLSEKITVEHYHRQVSQSMVATAMTTLMNDLYQIDVLPYAFSLYLSNNANLLAMFELDLETIIHSFGKWGILFSPNDSVIDHSVIGRSVALTPELFLTENPVGMPVMDFLLWRGSCKMDRKVMREWSGIPEGMQDTIYQQLLDAFRLFLKKEHAAEKRYSKVVFVKDQPRF